jgi:hypothetical protein
MFNAKLSPKINPKKVPTTPTDDPHIKKIRKTAPRVAPIVRKMAISLPLSLTNIIRLDTMLNAATHTINVKIKNITVRSTFNALNKLAFNTCQSFT